MTSPAPPVLGPLLARLRRDRGWSQFHLAAALCAASGVPTLTRHEVSRWERQRRRPGDFWLGWLAVVLGVPVGRLTTARDAGRRPHDLPGVAVSRTGPEPDFRDTAAPGPSGRRPRRRTGHPAGTRRSAPLSRRGPSGPVPRGLRLSSRRDNRSCQ